MDSSDETKQLLRDIRDTMREHVTDYKKFAEESVRAQDRAIRSQQKAILVQRIALVVGIGSLIAIMGLVFFKM